MKLKQIEKEALQLSAEERAQLVRHLIASLTPSQQNEAWSDVLATAQSRAHQIDSGEVETVAYSSVMEKARTMIR
ncbi:addiction module protein [Aliidiomarina soli]|uniref:Addiction module antitoxin RelB n=1 Tax=Aliidiomarina soli TaxID=1928574 RepID=A0A432WM47_9GAMM|nr:addiction module protein [Aliidiomarina soli]RUO34890.1 addiction module antitoxin RelB [Aliidiomarina soli]